MKSGLRKGLPRGGHHPAEDFDASSQILRFFGLQFTWEKIYPLDEVLNIFYAPLRSLPEVTLFIHGARQRELFS